VAKAVGIRGATLTHHLNGMEQAGRITARDPFYQPLSDQPLDADHVLDAAAGELVPRTHAIQYGTAPTPAV
jgi:hypothetical protein